MEHTLEPIVDTINALIALVVLYLGFRIINSMRFILQKRSVYLFLAATMFFALQETLAVIASTTLQSETLGIIREIIETAFIACLVIAMYLIVKSEKQEISKLHLSAETDALTKLYNISFFRRAASQKIIRAKEYGFPLTLLMLDVDDFKQYNDTFGHEAGNIAIQAVAQTLRETARTDDLLARYGGEEFISLLTTRREEAVTAAERIRASIESMCRPDHNPSLHRQITISIGAAELNPPIGKLEELIEAADKALYCAKKSGKNRVSANST